MGRPRKPSTRLELSGAFKVNPERRRPAEPRPDTRIGDPPARMSADEQVFWRELVEQAGEWLTGSDRWAVELASMLMCKFDGKNDGMTGAELATLRSLLGSLGLTPSDRSRISAPLRKPANRFETLADDA